MSRLILRARGSALKARLTWSLRPAASTSRGLGGGITGTLDWKGRVHAGRALLAGTEWLRPCVALFPIVPLGMIG
jgi:hypothetical protein